MVAGPTAGGDGSGHGTDDGTSAARVPGTAGHGADAGSQQGTADMAARGADAAAGRTAPGPFALYPLRLGLAIVFAYTGLEKLMDVAGQSAIVAFVGLPAPEATTVILGAVELALAAAILLGVMARTAGAAASVLMFAIIFTLKVPGPFWGDGWGIDVAVLAGTLTLALNGPGRPTLWSMLGREGMDPEARLGRRWSDRGRGRPAQ